MGNLVRLALTTAVASSAVVSFAQTLAPGSTAPPLRITKWYQGVPIKQLEKGKTYVIQFWSPATEPTYKSLPFLSELATKNPSVTFLGVGVSDGKDSGAVQKYLAEMGSKIAYPVGLSGQKGGMAKTWLDQASVRPATPSTFIVQDQRIVWIGIPFAAEETLKQVLAGTFDLERHKKDYIQMAESIRAFDDSSKLTFAIVKLLKEGKYQAASTKYDALIKRYPSQAPALGQYHLMILAKTKPSIWEPEAKAFAKGTQQERDQLSAFSLSLSKTKADMALRRKAVELLLAGMSEEDPQVFYAAASYYEAESDFARAIDYMNKAVETIPKSIYRDSPEIQADYKEYLRDLKKKAKG